jgi:putative ABC transport system substrate-binding protein
VAQPQASAHLPRIGYVATADESVVRNFPNWKALFAGLAELGMIEGRDFKLEVRSTLGKPERFESLTQELVNSKVDLLVAGVCGAPLNAARRATQSIPIVVPTCNDDLVELGIVNSLNRPGGNITGLSKLTPELAPKRLQLLLQTVPKARRVAVLWNPAYADFKADWRELRAAALTLDVTLLPVEFRHADEFEVAFEAAAWQRPDALIMFSDLMAYTFAGRVAGLATAKHLPAMFAFREVPDAGGLMSYGPNVPDMWRQSARHITRILRGTAPGELPIEQPTRFELVVNLKTAKALGLTVPQELLLRADAVIE